jgi:hypothetical protein
MSHAITAVNKKYQSAFNRAYKHLRAYHTFVNLDGSFETDKEQAKNDRQQEQSHDKYFEIFDVMPKREKSAFENQHIAIHGYF